MIEQITKVANDDSMKDYGFKRGSSIRVGEMKGIVTDIEISIRVIERVKKLYLYVDRGNNDIVRFWWDDPGLRIKIVKP